MAKKNQQIVVKVYINQEPVEAEGSASVVPNLLPLVKSGVFKPVNIISAVAMLIALGELAVHYLFGKG